MNANLWKFHLGFGGIAKKAKEHKLFDAEAAIAFTRGVQRLWPSYCLVAMGAFHSGLQVYGLEWSWGRQGVQALFPRTWSELYMGSGSAPNSQLKSTGGMKGKRSKAFLVFRFAICFPVLLLDSGVAFLLVFGDVQGHVLLEMGCACEPIVKHAETFKKGIEEIKTTKCKGLDVMANRALRAGVLSVAKLVRPETFFPGHSVGARKEKMLQEGRVNLSCSCECRVVCHHSCWGPNPSGLG